ncbi:MAG: hypothetical protein MJD61_04815 [Proteobacteria bacterium]|nr:hypothetical protein [Pseudomonadota bacterium]
MAAHNAVQNDTTLTGRQARISHRPLAQPTAAGYAARHFGRQQRLEL